MQLEGRSALVTGASRGLGKELAHALAARGARVVMVARGEGALAAAAEEVRSRSGEAHALAFDVGDKDDVHRITGAAQALVGPIDVLVHNASTLGPVPMPLLVDTSCEAFERVLQVNLVGPLRLTKAVALGMTVRGGGVVLFVSSDAAVAAYTRWGAYGVSKAAQDHLARSFAAESSTTRFLAVDPGEMDTAMHAAAMPDADRATLASPASVARRLVTILAGSGSIPNGSRVLATDFPEAAPRRAR